MVPLFFQKYVPNLFFLIKITCSLHSEPVWFPISALCSYNGEIRIMLHFFTQSAPGCTFHNSYREQLTASHHSSLSVINHVLFPFIAFTQFSFPQIYVFYTLLSRPFLEPAMKPCFEMVTVQTMASL